MKQRVISTIFNCARCKRFKKSPIRAPLKPIIATCPNELVHLDYVSFEVSIDPKEQPKQQSVLVVQDHFTKLIQAFPMPN